MGCVAPARASRDLGDYGFIDRQLYFFDILVLPNLCRSSGGGAATLAYRASLRPVGGVNTYSYVGGNPVSFVDPFGLYKEARLGFELTAFGLVSGGSFGVSLGFSSHGVSFNVQGCAGAGAGVGAFFGVGGSIGVEDKPDPMVKGSSGKPCENDNSVDKDTVFTAAGGGLIFDGASVDLSGDGSGDVSGKLTGGVGAGAFAAVMMCTEKTWP